MEETGKSNDFISSSATIINDASHKDLIGEKKILRQCSSYSLDVRKDKKFFTRTRSCYDLRRDDSHKYESKTFRKTKLFSHAPSVSEFAVSKEKRFSISRSISTLDIRPPRFAKHVKNKFTNLLGRHKNSYDLKDFKLESQSISNPNADEIRHRSSEKLDENSRLARKNNFLSRISDDLNTSDDMFSYLAKVHCERAYAPRLSKQSIRGKENMVKLYATNLQKMNRNTDSNFSRRNRSISLVVENKSSGNKSMMLSKLRSFTTFDYRERPCRAESGIIDRRNDAKIHRTQSQSARCESRNISKRNESLDKNLMCVKEERCDILKAKQYSNETTNLKPFYDAWIPRERTCSRVLSSASPSTRRRRVSVKSSHIRKQSIKPTQPRQRRLTVSSSSFQSRGMNIPTIHRSDGDASNIASAVIPSRRLSVAVGRKPSNVSQKRPQRRSSEPFLLDPLTIQNKWGRKYSTVTRAYGRRRVSTTATLPTSSKQKLQALAKDELLASLNVPLSRGDLTETSPVEKPDELSETVDDQKTLDDKKRKENKRMMIIEEILETEKNYISCLETLNIVFRTQLENSNIITVKDLMSLFPSHLHEIKNSHTWFMKELEERMHHENWRGIIGDIFAKMTSASANLLEIYTCYVNAFPKSISTLSKCTRSSQKFRKFLEDCYENPLVERLDLPSFLLSPVQRLPRYILLLRELLKYTNEDHPDHYFIGEAMKEMESLISSLNDSIQSSMEFYSASEGRRKKMSRQFTSKKRKQRTSQINRSQKKLVPLTEARSTDADQGYCSFSERKDESPEDDTQNPRKTRSSTWRGGASKRSMSMISSSSEENKASGSGSNNNGNVPRRKPEFGRNSDTRKSWRRSLGAVFSQIWSKDEAANRETHPRRESASVTYKSADGLEKMDVTTSDKSKSEDDIWKRNSGINENNLSVCQDKTDSSLFKRKSGVQSPTSTTQESVSIQDISNLIRDSSLDESQSLDVPIAVSSMNSSANSIDDVDRRQSVVSNKSTNSLQAPSSPQFFRRDKLRGSAGPAFKSIFNKSKLNKKTLSWDELNVERSNSYSQAPIDKKQKRYSISIRRPKIMKQDNIKDLRPLVMEKSASSNNVNDEETRSTSSNDTASSRTGVSQSLSQDEFVQDVVGDTNNNTTSSHSNRPTKEKKHKFMKTLKSFVSKTK